MQIEVFERQGDAIVVQFVVRGEHVFYVSNYHLDPAPVTWSHLKDCVSKRRKECVCVRRAVRIRVVQREQMNLAMPVHQCG